MARGCVSPVLLEMIAQGSLEEPSPLDLMKPSAHYRQRY